MATFHWLKSLASRLVLRFARTRLRRAAFRELLGDEERCHTLLAGMEMIHHDRESVDGRVVGAACEEMIAALAHMAKGLECIAPGHYGGIRESLAVIGGEIRALLAAQDSAGILELVALPHLPDPEDPHFLVNNCRTLRDILQFICEKALAAMFSPHEGVGRRTGRPTKLAADLPLALHAIDLGNGFASGVGRVGEITPDQITSVPFQAFWLGMTESLRAWAEESVRLAARLPAGSIAVSAGYLNVRVRSGSHSVVVDALCRPVDADNHLSVRFEGEEGFPPGHAPKTQFVQTVLEQEGFAVQAPGDCIYARITGVPRSVCRDKLELMGGLLTVTRLLNIELTDRAQVARLVDDFQARRNTSREQRGAAARALEGSGAVAGSHARAPTYPVTWITSRLAVGHAPTSYEELDSIKAQGIDAIVNLCGEFCDLHQIEKDYGFEVRYLPIADDDAPEMEALEQALAWLDEAIYLGKKVLVHCRLGIGRTGTFVRSYLLRRGFGAKLTEEKLQQIRSHPTSFNQWRFLRKYGKKEGRLTIREPSLEGERPVDLDPYFAEYENLCEAADRAWQSAAGVCPSLLSCGGDTDVCCTQPFSVQFVEAVYLYHHMNRELPREMRLQVIEQARLLGRTPRPRLPGSEELVVPVSTFLAREEDAGGTAAAPREAFRCPLSFGGKCLLYGQRPIRCRVFGLERLCEPPTLEAAGGGGGSTARERFPLDQAKRELFDMSRRLFMALNGSFLEGKSLFFPVPHVLSGRFIQDYFALLAATNSAPSREQVE